MSGFKGLGSTSDSNQHADQNNSPGSPTVGGMLNTNGERVSYTKKGRSVASSFKSNRRSEYSMMDYRTM